jgi:hypothetical protein
VDQVQSSGSFYSCQSGRRDDALFLIKNQDIIGNLNIQISYRPMQSTKPRRADTDFERSERKDQSPDHTTAV